MLLKQGPWVAREGGCAESALVAAAISDLGKDVKFWGSSGASQPPPLATPVRGGPCVLVSDGTNRWHLSLVSLLSLEVT